MPIEKDTASILRRDDEPYMAISREVVQMIQQAEALAIWTYLQSKPLNWTIRKKDVMQVLGLGEDRYKKGMDYLKDLDLITTALSRGPEGKLEGKITWCHARPNKLTEVPENRTSGNPVLRENTIHKDIQSTKDLNNNTSKNKFSDIHRDLSEYLLCSIRDINPKYKTPDLDKWSNSMRLLMERDHRSYNEIKSMIDWINRNSFWQGNILSPNKLREKWDRLETQKSKKPITNVNNYTDGAI